MKIAVLNGPNLNRLGLRESGIYGSAALADLERAIRGACEGRAELEFFQSNHEGALVNKLGHLAERHYDGIVFNPGPFTHTSVALHDAIRSAGILTVEVHISNIFQREDFRHVSLTAPACVGVIAGLGIGGYVAALKYLLD